MFFDKMYENMNESERREFFTQLIEKIEIYEEGQAKIGSLRCKRRFVYKMKIENSQCGSGELEFAIFCIENVASRLNADAQKVYAALTEQTNILNEYIIPEYEVLHTQSKDYIVDDIIDIMRERGVKL